MRKSKRQKQVPPQQYEANSAFTSPRCSTVLSDWDADDEFMSSGEHLSSRPLSLAIPAGPYCPRRPTLREVLANSAPPPWTLSAFMAYLSQNHCLETLEFTMDASRYRKHYDALRENSHGLLITPSTDGCEYVRMLWQKLLDAYITPNGPREVNLPSDVRDRIVSAPNHFTPPHPSQLDTAVRIVYELMDESVLVPFLNSVSVRGPTTYSSPYPSTDDMSNLLAQDSRANAGSSAGASSGSSRDTQSYSGPLRPSQPSHLALAIKRGFGSAYTSSSTSSAEGNEDSYTDDSLSTADSPSSMGEPMTPPITPPTSDTLDPADASPKAKADESAWKKMGFKWALRKTRSSHHSESSGSTSTSTSSYPHAPRHTSTHTSSTTSSYPHAPRNHHPSQ